MQPSSIGLLTRISELLNQASISPGEVPDSLCEFTAAELGFSSVVLFRIMEGNTLVVLGKSRLTNQIFSEGSEHSCNKCSLFSKSDAFSFSTGEDCELQTGMPGAYESCVLIRLEGNERVFLKVSKESPFNSQDQSNLEAFSGTIRLLMKGRTGETRQTGMNLSKMITEVAHELRSPTNSIMGFASLLNEDSLTSSQAEYVTTLKENAYNLLSLINDIVEIAKIENQIVKRNDTLINLKHFLDDIIALFADKIDKGRVEFLTNLEKGVPDNIKVDAQKLRYILMNILTVSVRLIERGKVSVSVTVSGNDLTLKINDTTAGFTSGKIKELFNPFALVEAGNTKIGATSGLGLTLSRLYIKLLDGTIDVTSVLGKGTTYTFSVKMEPLSSIESSLNQIPKPGKNNRVLVIEDDYATSKLLNNYLTKWGYEPVIVNSAGEAMQAVEKEIFLAVLMDIILPDANGFELLKDIREHRNARNTPVIVCSVEAEQQKAFLMGAVEYFVKPIKYKFLVEVLQNYKLKRDSNVLIVDDDVPTLNLLKQAVEQLGFNAIAESYPERLPSMVDNLNLDLAIIDLDMPVLNGFDLIKIIKSKPKFAKLPIVIYTGKENYKEDLKKIEGLFEELLQKRSTNIEELSETINQMINRYEVPSPPEEVDKETGTRILLVEDYKHSQIIVTRLLKKNGFDSIIVVENGAEALDQVQKHKFDLILMDMQMPVMNGFEATQRIRQIEQYKDTPIIALTAFAMKGDREKCLDAGATDYIPKPIDSQEFIEKVKFYTESKVGV